jgi:ketosteroid isomerase-like protein
MPRRSGFRGREGGVLDKGARDVVRARLRDGFAARARRDYDAVKPAFADNAAFRIAGDPRVTSFPGEVRGREAIAQAFEAIDSLFDLDDYRLVSLILDGDHAAARYACDLTCRATGRAMLFEAQGFMTLDANGFVTEYIEVFDTAGLAQIMQPDQRHVSGGADAAPRA